MPGYESRTETQQWEAGKLSAELGPEQARVAQILGLPFQERLTRTLELLGRTYRLGWDNRGKYLMGDLELHEANDPYQARRMKVD